VRDIVGRGQIKHSEFAMASGELSHPGFVEFLKQSLTAVAAVSHDGAVEIEPRFVDVAIPAPPRSLALTEISAAHAR